MSIMCSLDKALFCFLVMAKANYVQCKGIFAQLSKVRFYSPCGQQLQAISLDP